MSIVIEQDGAFHRISGSRTVRSLDGESQASLKTIMSPSWTWEDRAKYGIYQVDHVLPVRGGTVRIGTTYQRRNGKIYEIPTVEDKPQERRSAQTPDQKVAEMLGSFQLTLEEFKKVISS